MHEVRKTLALVRASELREVGLNFIPIIYRACVIPEMISVPHADRIRAVARNHGVDMCILQESIPLDELIPGVKVPESDDHSERGGTTSMMPAVTWNIGHHNL